MSGKILAVTAFNINARYDDYKKDFYKKCTADFAPDFDTGTPKLNLTALQLSIYKKNYSKSRLCNSTEVIMIWDTQVSKSGKMYGRFCFNLD